MRILQVIHGFLPQFRGGTELYLLGLSRELRRLGHEVHILTGTTDVAEKAHVETYHFDGFPVRKVVLSGSYLEHWTRSFSPEASRLFAEAVAEIKPDLVHVQHWYRLSRSLLESCHRMGIPALCTLHDLWTSCPRIFRIRNESFCQAPLAEDPCTGCVPRFPWMEDEDTALSVDLFRADFVNELALAHRIIVPSEAHGNLMNEVMDLPEDRLQVVPHGSIIHFQKDRPARPPRRRSFTGRRRFFGRRESIRLGVWGHLFHMKGVHLILGALQELRDRGRFELHVWGRVTEPRYKERLEELSRGLNVHWHGAFVPEDLREVDLDLAVIPSLCSESFSFVLDEAFDLNLPAIVPRRGALEERVGSAGTTFIPEDAQDLARVFKTILKKPDLIDLWRRSIPEPTTMIWHAKEVDAIYRDVLKRADRIELKGDASLPWRRLEFQTEINRRQEEMMFGYLGHIKREMGRGDHFEKEMHQLMAEKEEWHQSLAEAQARSALLDDHRVMVDVLAGEVDALRRALIAVHVDDPELRQEAPEVPMLESHVPGLGALPDVVTTNQKLLEDYSQAVAGLRQAMNALKAAQEQQILDHQKAIEHLKAAHETEIASSRRNLGERLEALEQEIRTKEESYEEALEGRDRVIEVLGEEILRLREALEALAEGRSLSTQDLPTDDVPAAFDVPGLGPLDEALQNSRALIEGAAGRVAQRAGEARDDHLWAAFLAAEIRAFRSAIAGLFDPDSVGASEVDQDLPDVVQALPELGFPQDVLDVDQKMRASLGQGFDELRHQVEEHLSEMSRLQSLVAGRDEELSHLNSAHKELEASLRRQTLLLEFLGQLMEELRRGMTAFMAGEELSPFQFDLPEDLQDHVPGLGDLATIHQVNMELLKALHDSRLEGDEDQDAASPDGETS